MDQPKLSHDLVYAIDVVNVAMRWEWPYGYHVAVSYRRSGEETFTTIRCDVEDAAAAADAVNMALVGVLGLA